MTIAEFIEFAKQKGFQNTQVVRTKIKNADLKVQNGVLNQYNISNHNYYRVKIEYLGKVVGAASNELTEELIELLEWKAHYQENKDSDYFTTDTTHNNSATTSWKISSKEEIAPLLELSKMTQKYPQIYKSLLEYEETVEETGYYNSNGVVLEDTSHTYGFLVEVCAEEKGSRASHYELFYDTSKENWDLTNTIEKVAQESILMLKAHSISSGNYPVILHNRVMNEMLENYITMFSAELIQRKQSPLEGKRNTQIFSSLITLKEEPNRQDLCGYRSFDNEGTKTKDRILVENGILKGILYNNKTAIKDHTTSTGNNYDSISTRNCYIVPGEKSLEELLMEKEELIVVTSISGKHCGIDTVSGDFSLQAEGYLVRKGKREEELKLFVISDNIFSLLQKVEVVGNDLTFLSDAVGSPSLLIREISVAGSEE